MGKKAYSTGATLAVVIEARTNVLGLPSRTPREGAVEAVYGAPRGAFGVALSRACDRSPVLATVARCLRPNLGVREQPLNNSFT